MFLRYQTTKPKLGTWATCIDKLCISLHLIYDKLTVKFLYPKKNRSKLACTSDIPYGSLGPFNYCYSLGQYLVKQIAFSASFHVLLFLQRSYLEFSRQSWKHGHQRVYAWPFSTSFALCALPLYLTFYAYIISSRLQ